MLAQNCWGYFSIFNNNLAFWNEWGDWGSCSKTCGSGEKTRSRDCSEPEGCTGNSSDTQVCTEQKCRK